MGGVIVDRVVESILVRFVFFRIGRFLEVSVLVKEGYFLS